MSNDKIISINNLYSVYSEGEQNQFVALNNVNYEFKENKIYCIIGNSGSGKSTLVTHFNGLNKTKYGTLDVFATNQSIPESVRKLFTGFLQTQTGYQYAVFNHPKITRTEAKIIIEVITKTKVDKITPAKQLTEIFDLVDDQNKISKLHQVWDFIAEEQNQKAFKKIRVALTIPQVEVQKKYSVFAVNFLKPDHKGFYLDTRFDWLLNYTKVELNKELKKTINQLKLINLGFNWNLDNLILGILVNEDKKQVYPTIKNFEEIVVFNTNKISVKLAKILIEGYYKVKVEKIKRIKTELINNKQHSVFLINYDLDDNLQIIDTIPLSEIKQINTTQKINRPNLLEYRKMKKIKNFKQLRRQIGMVFQFPEYQLFKDTIEKDIMFGPIALGVKKEEAKARAKIYLNKLGLGDEYLTRNPFGLSGGQKRRVAIAGILAIQTDVLIFDEPTAGLDPVGEQETMKMILNHKKENKTVFVITHTMDHVLQIADEVIVLNDGEIIAHGDPYAIFLDDKIIESTSIDIPKVIRIIKKLIQKDIRFKQIIAKKPRTIEELAEAILAILPKQEEQMNDNY